MGIWCMVRLSSCGLVGVGLTTYPPHTNRAENGAAPVSWVETGDAVSAQYAEARAEARQKALLRNACFQQVGVVSGFRDQGGRSGS